MGHVEYVRPLLLQDAPEQRGVLGLVVGVPDAPVGEAVLVDDDDRDTLKFIPGHLRLLRRLAGEDRAQHRHLVAALGKSASQLQRVGLCPVEMPREEAVHRQHHPHGLLPGTSSR